MPYVVQHVYEMDEWVKAGIMTLNIKDVALQKLDPLQPQLAVTILTCAGYEDLGKNYAEACGKLNRCANFLLRAYLRDDNPLNPFEDELATHTDFRVAKLAMEHAWRPIEQLRTQARERLSLNEPTP